MSGFLFTLEGLDGSGKTTIAEKIAPFILNEFGQEILMLKEPGHTRLGQEIRGIVHNIAHHNRISPRAEALLYQAARAQLVDEVITPALAENRIIGIDRFRDSSTQYQGRGRGLGIDQIEQLNDFSTGGLHSDLTILYDIPVEIMKKRLQNNGREINRMDMQSDEFYEIIRQGYLRAAEWNYGQRWEVINASRPLEEVWKDTKTILKRRFEGHFGVEGRPRRAEGEN